MGGFFCVPGGFPEVKKNLDFEITNYYLSIK